MHALYESVKEDLEIFERVARHVSPNINDFIECLYVTSGNLELGVGRELYHMEEGDFGITFPGQIHHAQVFDPGKCTAIYLLISRNLSDGFVETVQQKEPRTPVIPAADVHPDVVYALKSLLADSRCQAPDQMIHRPFCQIILARTLPLLQLQDRQNEDSGDLTWRVVVYIARHFRESVSLTSMARDLYVSPYALSRIFSGVFHTNFNGYLNESRIDYACSLLRYTDSSITEIAASAGFESLRTFNRTFQNKMHLSPRAFRTYIRETAPSVEPS